MSARDAGLNVLAVVWSTCFSLAMAEAGSGDADGTYTVTITKIEVSTDQGTTYTTVFSGSQAINIASVGANTVAAGLVSGASLDAGTYDRLRVTIGDTLQLKGFRNTGGGATDYTNGTTFNTVAGDSAGSDYAVSSFTIDAANRVQTFTISIVVKPGGSPRCTVKFDTQSVIGAGYTISPPAVSVTTG